MKSHPQHLVLAANLLNRIHFDWLIGRQGIEANNDSMINECGCVWQENAGQLWLPRVTCIIDESVKLGEALGRQAILFICFQSVCLFASWFANVYTSKQLLPPKALSRCLSMWHHHQHQQQRWEQQQQHLHHLRHPLQHRQHLQPAAVVNRQIVSIFAGSDVELSRDLISSHTRTYTHTWQLVRTKTSGTALNSRKRT